MGKPPPEIQSWMIEWLDQGFDGPSSNTDDEASLTVRNLSNRLQPTWKGREASSSDQGNTSSATSKM